MFDIGAIELLIIVIVAVVVIGQKDMPLAMRTAGRWIGKIRRVSGHFRSGLDAMIREAEMEEMDKKWRERNAEIMAKYPADYSAAEEMVPLPELPSEGQENPSAAEAKAAHAESRVAEKKDGPPAPDGPADHEAKD